ncbi:hypothetical protein TSUD_214610 [Trifolium subterraneum]|uniref:Uncharacterized protein n=1 Tax=Trifolium subterraneum TaxID=3900 RepID=A0A2Z6N4V2_TRISU|nr:hypothetical protein TSUD_214610 [Trifolium subterraneum]
MTRLEKLFAILDGFFQNVVDEHLDPERKQLSPQEDVIDALIGLKNDPYWSMDLRPEHIKPLIMLVHTSQVHEFNSHCQTSLMGDLQLPT